MAAMTKPKTNKRIVITLTPLVLLPIRRALTDNLVERTAEGRGKDS
jgi:hypothetical protein